MEPLESRHLLSGAVLAGVILPPSVLHVAATTSTVTSVVPIPVTIQAVVGAAFTGDVGKISGLSPTLLPRLKAFINWGDSTSATSLPPSSGTIYFDATGILHVRGTHTYQQAGTFPVTVSVILNPLTGSLQPSILYTINSKAVVIANSLGGVTLNETANVTFTAIVGYFNLPPNPIASAVQPVLKALINWGDGTTSLGTILALPTTVGTTTFAYAVQGTHTYANSGTFPIAVTVFELYSGLPGPTPLLSSPIAAEWIRLIARINSMAIVAPGPVV
jgi:hypothetical protein